MTRLMGTLIGLLLNGKIKIDRIKLVLQYMIGCRLDMNENMRVLLAPLAQNMQIMCAATKIIYHILQNTREDPFDVI